MDLNLIHYPSVASTQQAALDLLSSHPVHGTTIWADDQTAGRGQAGSSWVTAPGQNLTFSLILMPGRLEAQHIARLNWWASVAVAHVLTRHLPGIMIAVKWPNDVLAQGRKVCGMIFNNQIEGGRVRSAILGLGLNVNQIEFGPGAPNATSMRLLSGKEFGVKAILEELLGELAASYPAVEEGNGQTLLDAYLNGMHGYRQWVRCRIAGEEVTVFQEGVDPHGRLLLRHGGRLHSYEPKQVEHIL